MFRTLCSDRSHDSNYEEIPVGYQATLQKLVGLFLVGGGRLAILHRGFLKKEKPTEVSVPRSRTTEARQACYPYYSRKRCTLQENFRWSGGTFSAFVRSEHTANWNLTTPTR